MSYPLISICIPSYNRPNELGRLLNSVDCNSSEVEIVICEDVAPLRDKVRIVVKSFSVKSDYSVNYHENKTNLGFDGNLRRLGEVASGKYVLFMGDDDVFVPNRLDQFIKFLKLHCDKPYVLRSYIVQHSNGNTEYFCYLPKSQTLTAGVSTVAWLFKRSVTICGFTISREMALKFASNKIDGTLLYQVYLMAQVCLHNNSIYYDLPFVKCTQEFRKDKPMFGSSKAEKNRYTPGAVSSDNSINFTKAYFELTAYLDKLNGINLSKLVLVDISKYSYPFLSIQRKRGITNFLNYTKRLENEVGLGCTIYFYIYKWALVLLGEKFCDRIIVMIKRLIGYTPNF